MTTKDRIQLSVIGVGLLALVFLIPSTMRDAKKRRAIQKAAVTQQESASESEAPEEEPAAPGMVLEPLDEAQRQQQLAVLKEPWGRDPFLQKGLPAPTLQTELVLKGVARRADGQVIALINEEIVQEGDRVEGHTVKRIEPAQVILQRDGREFILKLEEEP